MGFIFIEGVKGLGKKARQLHEICFDPEAGQTSIELSRIIKFSTSKRSYKRVDVRPLRGREGLKHRFL